jgi:regulator of protease activity HflC (stomatin/prohibitin superfamily)
MPTQYQEERKRIRRIVIAALIILPVVFLWSSLTYTIDSGHAGLVFHTFGNGINPETPPKTSGFHLKAPWDKVYEYEVRQQELFENLEVLSSNLLKIKLDMTVFYQPTYDKLGYLEIERGSRYESKVIQPAMRSVAREVIAQYLPEEFNTTKREQIQLEIEKRLEEKLTNNYIQLNDVLIRNIELPLTLQQAIERKLQQEQESLEYEFRIEKASKEAERKRIEAEGIRDFQNIVTQSITDKLLKWKGIEATTILAESNNAKVVVIGSGENGLPLILGGN